MEQEIHLTDCSAAVGVLEIAAGGGDGLVVLTAFAVETHFLVIVRPALVDDFDLVSASCLPSLKACYYQCVKMTLQYCLSVLVSL